MVIVKVIACWSECCIVIEIQGLAKQDATGHWVIEVLQVGTNIVELRLAVTDLAKLQGDRGIVGEDDWWGGSYLLSWKCPGHVLKSHGQNWMASHFCAFLSFTCLHRVLGFSHVSSLPPGTKNKLANQPDLPNSLLDDKFNSFV